MLRLSYEEHETWKRKFHYPFNIIHYSCCLLFVNQKDQTAIVMKFYRIPHSMTHLVNESSSKMMNVTLFSIMLRISNHSMELGNWWSWRSLKISKKRLLIKVHLFYFESTFIWYKDVLRTRTVNHKFVIPEIKLKWRFDDFEKIAEFSSRELRQSVVLVSETGDGMSQTWWNLRGWYSRWYKWFSMFWWMSSVKTLCCDDVLLLCGAFITPTVHGCGDGVKITR